MFLSKRRPQGRDLFTAPYGRFFHLPRLLAARGHEVHLLLLSYRRDPPASRRMHGLQVDTLPALPWGPRKYLARAKAICAEIHPDWIIGCSDLWYGILAVYLASVSRCRALIDAYDNFESYIPWAKPLHRAWRRALAHADAATAAGPQLAALLRETSKRAAVEVVAMAADPIFTPLPQAECRRRMGLPADRPLVGYTGSLHPNRGIDLLFAVYRKLRAHIPNLGLVLSGRLAKGIVPPPDAYWLGDRPAEQVPAILNSLDLLFVLNKPGPFGDYSYPVKLYEAMACGVPVVATDVPGTAWILREHPELLARAGDVEEFTGRALDLLCTRRKIHYTPSVGWEASAAQLHGVLTRAGS